MTSWKFRISTLGLTIYRFFKNQTVKPDKFYLWLAIPEFPNKEKDLPEDLLQILDAFNIILKWTDFNDYNFKRWYVYPEHYDDLVISIDDDADYDCNLIAYAKNCQSGITYNIFPSLTKFYNYKNKIYANFKFVNDKKVVIDNRLNFLACSIIPPKTFPLNAVTNENLLIRRRICKRCDESWIKPFLLKEGIQQSFIKNNSYLLPFYTLNATYKLLSQQVRDLRKRDIQLYIVLKQFPELFKSWRKVFPQYNPRNWAKYSMSELISFVQ